MQENILTFSCVVAKDGFLSYLNSQIVKEMEKYLHKKIVEFMFSNFIMKLKGMVVCSKTTILAAR